MLYQNIPPSPLTSNTDTMRHDHEESDARDSHIIFSYFIKLSLVMIIQPHLFV